jgi:hypothetical protein
VEEVEYATKNLDSFILEIITGERDNFFQSFFFSFSLSFSFFSRVGLCRAGASKNSGKLGRSDKPSGHSILV